MGGYPPHAARSWPPLSMAGDHPGPLFTPGRKTSVFHGAGYCFSLMGQGLGVPPPHQIFSGGVPSPRTRAGGRGGPPTPTGKDNPIAVTVGSGSGQIKTEDPWDCHDGNTGFPCTGQGVGYLPPTRFFPEGVLPPPGPEGGGFPYPPFSRQSYPVPGLRRYFSEIRTRRCPCHFYHCP